MQNGSIEQQGLNFGGHTALAGATKAGATVTFFKGLTGGAGKMGAPRIRILSRLSAFLERQRESRRVIEGHPRDFGEAAEMIARNSHCSCHGSCNHCRNRARDIWSDNQH